MRSQYPVPGMNQELSTEAGAYPGLDRHNRPVRWTWERAGTGATYDDEQVAWDRAGLRGLLAIVLLFVVGASCHGGVRKERRGALHFETKIVDLPNLWGSWASAIPDLDGDGFGDIAVADGVARYSNQSGFLGPCVMLYSGRNGARIGTIRDLPFAAYGREVHGLLDAHGICVSLVIGGVVAGSPPSLSVAIICPKALSTKRQMKMQLDSLFPLTDGVADAELMIKTECHLGPRGWRILMLVSDGSGNAGAFAWDLEVESNPYVIWPVRQRRGVLAKALAIVPDLDGDGLDDIAIGVQSVRPGSPGYVLLLNGKSGEEFKRLVAPEKSPSFGASLASLRGFRAEESVLLVGSPGRSKSEGGPGGRIYAFELRSGELRASVERPPLPLGHKLGPFDYFGNVVGAINCRDRQLVLVADRQVGVSDGGDLTSSLMGIDLELGQVVWSLSGDQSFIEGPSRIFEYGNGSRFSGPLKGAGGRIVVDAHVSGPAPGRIFVIDATDGEMLFEIESSVD